MTSVSISLENVRKQFDDVVALEEINLTVNPGELLVLLGPSGCGKSTTLRIMAGLELPTDGIVRMDGEDVTQTSPQARDLSMVFQNYALYPHKTVEQNLSFPLEKMDLTADERTEKIEWAAELLGISELLEKSPDTLSGGQRQRVALGRTIVREPGLFLMDEPLSNLDAELRVATRSELRSLQKELETTTVYVTHDQEEAMSIADRLVIMDQGEIVQVGSPKEIYRQPATEFVASFIGEPSMNFIPAGRGDAGQLQLDIEEGIDIDIRVPPGREISTMGVRPEDLYIGDNTEVDTDSLTRPIEMEIATIDPLGYSYEVSLTRDDHAIIGLIERAPPDIGDIVPVRFDATRIYAFDQAGKRMEIAQ